MTDSMRTCKRCSVAFIPAPDSPGSLACRKCLAQVLSGFIVDTEWYLAEEDRLDGEDDREQTNA